MIKFSEILGAVLEGFSNSTSEYHGIDNNSVPLHVDSVLLYFSNGILNIENPYEVIGKNHDCVDLAQLVGDEVCSAYSTDSELRIEFQSGLYLSVSLTDSDFRGPEAASYRPIHGSIIVFN